MAGFISAATGGYYEGDRVSALDQAVPQRPDATCSLVLGVWVPGMVPAPPVPIDARLWIERLSPAKRQAIWTAALANPSILGWVALACAAQAGIDVTNPETIAGVAALVAAGILTPADQVTLLTP